MYEIRDHKKIALSLRAARYESSNDTIPPQLSKPKEIVKLFSIGNSDAVFDPHIARQHSIEDLTIFIGVFYLCLLHVCSLLLQVVEVNQWINGRDEESYNGCCCVDAAVIALIGLIHYARELKSASQNESQVLVEDDRVEDEEMAFDKGNS